MLKRSDFFYNLPDELIAQYPADHRTDSKLLVYRDQSINDSVTRNLAMHVPENAVFVRNNSRVIPSRLLGETQHGGKVELMLIEPIPGNGDATWKAFGKPLKKMKPDSKLFFNGGNAYIEDRVQDEDSPYLIVSFDKSWAEFYSWIDKVGYIPLPPYIKREKAETAPQSTDAIRYQTVYAEPKGSVAAPTAGLHFTDDLIRTMVNDKGIEFVDITLHVGAGTFLPVKSEDIDQHKMHFETYMLPSASFQAIQKARAENRKVIAVGTTSLRCLESFFRLGCDTHSWDNYLDLWHQTNLFIRPKTKNDRFRPGLIDGIMTNFHQPESTLLMLISAMFGYDEVRRIYQHAIEQRYRFFSYGDSSLLMF
ncbi:tRNA preQ1(34) S-adenosylmethionine ribosyltransferase-isomerase QueA [Pseudobacteriovorax antillogorgiicola]|uniref:S-adenosylmethionine:tRNA ribosyltransferase-isomerase n=1 Tax=Pseudobacteriovorax antillogorgiicola TaxID=1513793 RepID=A0A1Y6B4Q9_9BACT|nr:tRNA preQ1(34) S-adenosylmethionine ribosyltransferase-isomerase QueA [Pseudobacteriovorax antillogorgiicola]TCS59247.1 S-adenosylmethionine:tRNA ribosyltransferase-isomerase [Pseudobacteriovorax antillogorgiicola]SME90090.1 S-adenosylmethionine:tRNA ribosyltransferase-isomerase [Pseudobacteriovorax antillogorgiicola]